MIISVNDKNNKNRLYLVYAFNLNAKNYMIFNNIWDDECIEGVGSDNSDIIVIENSYSKYWINDDSWYVPKEFLNKSLSIAMSEYSYNEDDKRLLWLVKEKVDAEYFELYAHQEKYATLYPELYKNPKIQEIGEDLGDNWIMCPNCNEAYEVTKDQGAIECTNVTCKLKFNNPYAKEFPSQED